VYSLNVPVPSGVARLASDLARELPGARPRRRGEHTLVCKRLDAGGSPGGPTGRDVGRGHDTAGRLDTRVREALAGTPPFAARVVGVDQFREAVTGPSPVVYLAVESPGLRELHERACETFDPVEGLEGDDYTPHVTVARGGSPAAVEAVCERSVDPVEWTVDELQVYDAEHAQPVSTLSLPA
jgi:hypothetical protein